MLQEKTIQKYANKLVKLESMLNETLTIAETKTIERQITEVMNGFMMLTHYDMAEAMRLDEAVQKLLTK